MTVMMIAGDLPQFRNQGPGLRAHLRTIKFLAATTAVPATSLHLTLLSAAVVFGVNSAALAEPNTDPVNIPLHHLPEQQRLGIFIGANGGAPHMYMFDTGSDQFNGQFFPKTDATKIGDPTTYLYGDGTYGNFVQQQKIDSISYYDAKGNLALTDARGHLVAQTLDIVYSQNYQQDPNNPIRLSDEPVYTDENGVKYFADLDAHQKIQDGQPAESDGTYGVFGAADFLMTSSANSSALGGYTTSGYIVAANANLHSQVTPGCAPCAIMNVDSNLRAQFTTFIPWQAQHGEDYRPNFPGSGANASTQYEGEYEYTFKFTVNGEQKTVTLTGPILLDTGTADEVYLSQKDAIAELEKAGLVVNENNDSDPNNGKIDSFTVQKAGDDGSYFEFTDIKLSRLSGEPDGKGLIIGLPFFHNNSVMYDLEKQATAYTPYFVSADNFTTDAPGAGELQLGRITAQMGSQHWDDKLQSDVGWFGIAGVISGSGSLMLDPKTVVRMTNVNTYTGATHISHDASLSLAGLGSIEHSEKVITDGTLDISEHGKANDYWGISDDYNDARIRSLGGGGTVALGDRTLVLTAAGDTFAGSINDLDDNDKNMGGALFVAGGVQTLSGKNDFAGMTTVGSGAGLLLTDTGSLTYNVTASGFLGNDGQIGGTALANSGGVVAGGGSYGAVTVANGGTVAPGSAIDPSRPVAALTVNGDFAQQADSIYQAGLASSSDLIDVGGSAAIDSGAQVELLRQGTASVDTRYTLLKAAGGVNGTYAGLTGTWVEDTPFVDFELAYDPQNVFLDISRSTIAFAEVGNTFNQRSAGAASEALGAGNPIHDDILFLTTPETRNAFDLLSGEIHASVHSALIQDSHFVRDAANDRIRAAFEGIGASPAPVMAYGPDGAETAPATTDKYAVWGRAFGAWGHLDGDGNAARLDRSTGGFMAGGDALVGEQWRVGLLAGYSHTSFDVDDRSSSGSSDNYHLGLYAGTQRGPLGFRSGLAYTWHRIETDRFVAFPGFADSLSADYDAGTFQAFGELGYRIGTASASFEPYANLAYVNFDSDGFAEEGGVAALSSRVQSSDTTFATLGLRASMELTLGAVNTTARGGIGWRHAFGDVRPETGLAFAGGSSFAIEGVPIAKNAARLEAGLDMKVTKNATLGIAYQGQVASDAQEHGFNAKLRVRF